MKGAWQSNAKEDCKRGAQEAHHSSADPWTLANKEIKLRGMQTLRTSTQKKEQPAPMHRKIKNFTGGHSRMQIIAAEVCVVRTGQQKYPKKPRLLQYVPQSNFDTCTRDLSTAQAPTGQTLAITGRPLPMMRTSHCVQPNSQARPATDESYSLSSKVAYRSTSAYQIV
eukprot:1151484-Pelagomonas_calceolata.AAC.12